MFLSKAYLHLRNSASKAFRDNPLPRRRFSDVAATATDAQPPTETVSDESSRSAGVPDKLYKKIEIELRGNEPAVMESYGKFATLAAEHLGIPVARNTALPDAVHQRLTVLKSIHVHKKHRVQYETRTYFRYLDFLHLTGSTADTFLEYIQRNLPEGVAMKTTKVEIQRIPDSVRK